MMKDILYFLQWQWQRFEFWQKCYMFAMFMIGCSTSASEPWRIYLFGIGAAVILGFMLKWVVWDGVKGAWSKYQEEKQQIVDIMSGKEKI
jgi:hypothetical protein